MKKGFVIINNKRIILKKSLINLFDNHNNLFKKYNFNELDLSVDNINNVKNIDDYDKLLVIKLNNDVSNCNKLLPYISSNKKLTNVINTNEFKGYEYENINKNKKIYNLYNNEEGYLQSIKDIIEYGQYRKDRTGTGTLSLFGLSYRYDLTNGFPLLTTKKMFIRGIIEELLWFLRGSTNIKELQDKDVHIWDTNDDINYRKKMNIKLPVGDLGPGYGFQFRYSGAKYIDNKTDYKNKGGIDQIEYVINLIKNNSYDRRMIINLWNPLDVPKMLLPPCHMVYHFWVSNDDRLYCNMYQRSGDIGLGVPYNIASASLLTHIIAFLTGKKIGHFIHNIGDAHIYNDHIIPLQEQIKRNPYSTPLLEIKKRNQTKVEDFIINDFIFHGYESHQSIKMNVS